MQTDMQKEKESQNFIFACFEKHLASNIFLFRQVVGRKITDIYGISRCSAWYLYEIRVQNTLRTCEGKQVIFENIFKFVTDFDVNK